jgi:hypothetical protein
MPKLRAGELQLVQGGGCPWVSGAPTVTYREVDSSGQPGDQSLLPSHPPGTLLFRLYLIHGKLRCMQHTHTCSRCMLLQPPRWTNATNPSTGQVEGRCLCQTAARRRVWWSHQGRRRVWWWDSQGPVTWAPGALTCSRGCGLRLDLLPCVKLSCGTEWEGSCAWGASWCSFDAPGLNHMPSGACSC